MFGIVVKGPSTLEISRAILIDRLRCATSMRRLAALAECGIGASVKWAHLALVPLAEPHDDAPCHKIHGLGCNKYRITNHRCVNQEE
jgi:hypothetical protein